MSKKDVEIRTTVESILERNVPGHYLKEYFDALPDKRIRRAIAILSDIYPDNMTLSDDEFSFILYLFSNTKFLEQESFSQFVRAVNIVNFTEPQKTLLMNAMKNNIEVLCEKCTFELGALLTSVFKPKELLQYLEILIEKGSRPVLHHVFNILLYEKLSPGGDLDKEVEELKHKASLAIKD